MLNTILGSKIEMSQAFTKEGRVPVTKILAGPCVVTQIKMDEKDGYWAVQLGFGIKKIKNTSKPLQGHLRGVIKGLPAGKAGKKAPRFLREVRLNSQPKFKVGDIITVSDIFSEDDVVSVTGTSKGKGFAGVVKRWGFKGGPRTHGQSDRQRAPGSIGQGTTPGRVHKGKKMPGRMGSDTVTVKNLKVVSVDPDKNELILSGPIPGSRGSLVVIKRLAKGQVKKEKVEQVEKIEQVEEEKKEVSKVSKAPQVSKEEKDVEKGK